MSVNLRSKYIQPPLGIQNIRETSHSISNDKTAKSQDEKYLEMKFGIFLVMFELRLYTGAKKYWHPYLINTIEMRSL